MRLVYTVFFFLLFLPLNGQVLSYKEEIKQYRSKNWAGLFADPRTTVKPGDSVYLRYYRVKETHKVFCEVEFLQDQPPFPMPTYSGQEKTFRRYAVLHFKWKGKKVSLSAYKNLQLFSPLYQNHLFIPFKDMTTGKQTYAGGRYLDIQATAIQNGRLLLDLNRVYNPWCAYSDGYNCPIPPAENHLKIALKAGEKDFKKPKS